MSFVCTPQIGSRQEMIFWKIVWTWLNLEFLLSSLEILTRSLTGPWIVVGRTRSMTPMKARWPFGNFLRSVVVVDIWRNLHPLTPGFTWESPDHARALRIDLIGCPAVWVPFVSFCNFVPCPFSDHSVVHLSISPPVLIPRGPGRWKCNISILEDPELRSEIESFWIYWRTRQPFFPSVRNWWDKGKKVIKSLISHHCSSKASKKRQELDLLTRLARHLKEKLDAGMTSVVEPLESVLLSIADMNRTAAVGARVRARAKWAEEGETSSRYFFRLEKKRGADQWCSALRMEDGTIVSGISDICAAWSAFYSSLLWGTGADRCGM